MAVDIGGTDNAGAARRARPDRGSTLCAAFVELLPVQGASISIVTETGAHSVVGASDALAVELEAWQFESGMGPHWEALRTERPAFLYDTEQLALQDAWPTLAIIGAPVGVGSLFAFPLHLGVATVGVADLYSASAAAPWASDVIDLAVDVALEVTAAAVRLATSSAEAVTSTTGPNAAELRREVHQATGMVMGQLDCDASTALLRLRGYSFASGVPLDIVAREIITRRLDFAAL